MGVLPDCMSVPHASSASGGQKRASESSSDGTSAYGTSSDGTSSDGTSSADSC